MCVGERKGVAEGVWSSMYRGEKMPEGRHIFVHVHSLSLALFFFVFRPPHLLSLFSDSLLYTPLHATRKRVKEREFRKIVFLNRARMREKELGCVRFSLVVGRMLMVG